MFVKDLLHRHRGEVREISGEWELVNAPLPEGERFHHAKFSLLATGSKELTTFTGKPGKRGGRQEGCLPAGQSRAGLWRQLKSPQLLERGSAEQVGGFEGGREGQVEG